MTLCDVYCDVPGISLCRSIGHVCVMIDSDMSWEHHIDTICCTISSRLSLLRRIKPYLNFDSALRFYNSCVNNYFIYCSAAWSNCSHHLILRLLRLQKRAGRLLLDADLSQSSISLFLKLNWIPVFDLIKYRKLFLLFILLLNPNAPKCLRNRFQFLCDSRGPLGPFTRASLHDLKVPCPHSNSGRRTLANSATKLFNDLSSNLKEFSISSSPLIFKFLPSSLKSWQITKSVSLTPILGRALGGSTVLDLPLFYSLSQFFIVLPQPSLRLLIHIYIYMYTCSFIVHIFLPFLDVYIIHYVFIVYSTLILFLLFVYIYTYL